MSTNQIPQRPQFGSSGQGAGEPVHISWSGSPWDLIGLSFVNFFLTIITLGIYSFWGKTEVRRRIWSSVRLQGEPLAYTGTGRELFVGFLIVFGAVLLPMYLLAIAAVLAFGPRSLLAVAVQYSLFALFLFLAGVATYRARRYRLTRTLWRGIRGGMAGSPAGYATTSFFSSLLLPLSLGWTSPWQANLLHKRLASETTFGNQQFAYEGGSGPMYGRFALLWVGGLVLYFGMLGTIFMAFGPRLQALAVGA